MSKSPWIPKKQAATKTEILKSILSIINNRGFQYLINIIHKTKIPIDQMKIAEIGCGRGVSSLVFALLGASVTLIDNRKDVLDNAKNIYEAFGCQVSCVQEDCLEVPSSELIESFHLVSSYGLAEHFEGEDREKCFSYHKHLLKKGGFVNIETPNKINLFYWFIRGFCLLISTWDIPFEQAYTNKEFKVIGAKLQFSRVFVVGITPLHRDAIKYIMGMISAFVLLLPNSLRNNIRLFKHQVQRKVMESKKIDIRNEIEEKIKQIESKTFRKSILTDYFSWGISFFGFKD
ncbi:MAG: class I SAM-dependent methyltransferase [Candidatus Omnitrophota bacterium]